MAGYNNLIDVNAIAYYPLHEIFQVSGLGQSCAKRSRCLAVSACRPLLPRKVETLSVAPPHMATLGISLAKLAKKQESPKKFGKKFDGDGKSS
jgi:hypothetical protein